jgi:hypothetical protein
VLERGEPFAQAFVGEVPQRDVDVSAPIEF